ncbi:hypothetical protein KIN34_11730 [Cellulomonas sp. DKR-3]|uniref:Pyrimidine dimer DNA glycosylase /DNA-(Apurinic or apyrimidinic site) lyase n=1 Tax=Cellulomonas fulva TaxID=2835530 RepID=A0ABS5U0M2_9CELL|nr:pyrimidine dimer DNA glycosylase/endonuclease V [Cellulomonas fulva]MBT0994953.1 hypothetical protein [Cellulomonas fulva]
MRLWSLHPEHLDQAGLVACWREALLAQAVLLRPEGGYSRHPQLERFRAAPVPLATAGRYLEALADEADLRGYRFDRGRIRVRRPADGPGGSPTDPPGRPTHPDAVSLLVVTDGQLAHEREHLLAKLDARAPEAAARLRATSVRPHPSFVVVPGPVAAWERA